MEAEGSSRQGIPGGDEHRLPGQAGGRERGQEGRRGAGGGSREQGAGEGIPAEESGYRVEVIRAREKDISKREGK